MKTTKRTLPPSLFASLLLLVFAPAAARARQAEATFPLRAAQYRLARLAPDRTTDEALFSIDRSNVVSIDIIATVGGLTTSVVTPSGQVITPANVASLGGSYETAEGGATGNGPSILPAASRGFHYLYAFPWQGAGDYRVRFNAPPGITGDVPVFTEVVTDSPVRARLFATEQSLVLGRPAVLTAAVFDGASPVAGASVAVSINAPTGPPLSLTLRDDGGAADDAAGDGLYSGEFTPAAAGNYGALALITGTTAGGVAYSRTSAAELFVVDPPSRLNGTLNDNGVDDNGDGLFDRVAFGVGTQTTTAGRYRAFVHLKTAGGRKLVGSSDADLTTGTGTLQVSVPAADIRALGENGPYTIEAVELDLLAPTGAAGCDRIENAGQTRAYLLSQFQRKPLVLTGLTTDQGFDDNGNGQFDRLRVTVQADVLFAGFYQWNMKLLDGGAREIAFARGSGSLGSGLNNLTFTYSGSAIGASGADGPFRLADLVLLGPNSIVVADVGTTQAYRSAQFEGGRISDVTPPRLTVTLTPTTLWPANHRMATVNAGVTVSDDTDPRPTVTLVSVTSSEPDDGLGDGDTSDDIQGASAGTDDREFQLRAERSGRGAGRTYTVVYRARDASGNTTTVTALVNVPHSQGK